MYVLEVKDASYNKFSFRFKTMEEVGIFVDTALSASTNEGIEISVKKEAEEE